MDCLLDCISARWLRTLPLVFVGIVSTARAAPLVQAVKPDQPPAANGAKPVKSDPELHDASEEIGRALILRCLCAQDTLRFDASGTLLNGPAKTTDWTLAGVNVMKVEREGPDTIELDGVRVAARFAADRKEFDRHPLTTETMRITVADDGNAAAFQRTLAAIFAQGIDLRLQESLPSYWRHYFEPKLAWGQDALSHATIYEMNARTSEAAEAADAVSSPVPTHRAQPDYTAAAEQDRVQGAVVLHLVVDANGSPQRISLAQPLGYGLDAQAVAAIGRYRFAPGRKEGQPVACGVFLQQRFAIATAMPPM